jgi:hypothetical protein
VDGFSRPYVAAVAYASAFYGFLAVLLGVSAARALRRSPVPAYPEVLAGTLIWCGTPLLFYMYVAPPYAHAASAFAVALFVWLWVQVRRAWSVRGAAALGLSAALMAMVREQDAFLALGPVVDFLVSMRGDRTQPPTRPAYAQAAAAGLLAFALGYAPQLLAYSALNGYPGPSRLVARKMLWSSPHALQVLLSPEHGFFWWTPLAAMSIAGLAVLALRGDAMTRRVGACALLMVAATVYVSGSVDSWTVAGAFGQRRFVAITALLIVGLATLLRSMPARASQLAAGTAVALCVWWNLALMAAFGTGLMDRQRLDLKRNAYVAFVTIPRMAPELAARYFTRRDSFYQQSQREP